MYATRRKRRLPQLFRRFRRGPRLAIHLGVIVCALASQSCLVPQSVDPIPESPHPPPYFEGIPESVMAPVLHLDKQGTADVPCHCVLEIPPLTVHEDDPTVDLQARWFIDYDVSVPRSEAPFGGISPLPGRFNDATYTDRVLNKFDFDADAALVTSNGVHILEVVVGETAGFDDSPTAPLPFRSMKPGYTQALYRFAIDVNVQQITGSCAKIPAVPVCQ